jgi:hypothetical protein
VPKAHISLPHVKPQFPIEVPLGGGSTAIGAQTSFLHIPSADTPPSIFVEFASQPFGQLQGGGGHSFLISNLQVLQIVLPQ